MHTVRNRRGLATIAALAGLATTLLVAPPTAVAANPVIAVDLGASTGAITHGASGNLYGLADPGIPSANLIAPISPNTAAQKAPDGLQHPNGDALVTGPAWLSNGGKDVLIYMQDIFRNFPYENPGIDDYKQKVATQVRKVMAAPNHAAYVYLPFNEPDGNWYGSDIAHLEQDWKTIFQTIRSIDPSARIASPGYSGYRSTEYRQFFTFAKANNVLPDVTVWHELGNDFFTDWYNHYADYRSIESSLGISPRPINISEYGRSSGDLGVPGNLVQWVTRLENSKVTGCLAFWTDSGSLNDLVANFESNKPTGGWWLYKWYGDMTGNTVRVTPPSQNGSLKALATYDSAKTQARVLLGGAPSVNDTFATDVSFRNVPSRLGSSVHATVYGVDTSGTAPSAGPYVVAESDAGVVNGTATVSLANLKGSSAYEVILTPNTDRSAAQANRYEAEYATLSGSARVTYGSNTGYSGTYFTEGYGASNNASTTFVTSVPADGYYNVGLRYAAGPYSGAPANRVTRLTVDGTAVRDVSLPGTTDWNTWNTVTTKVFLTGGVNRIGVNAFTTDDSDAINVDYLDVAATSGTVTAYEAESANNSLSGTAVVQNSSSASGGRNVGYIGNGSANTLTFNGVTAASAGTYRMVVTYANGEYSGGGGAYNTNSVNRYADISVNGGTTTRSWFRVTGSFSTYRTAVIDVALSAGSNRITFGNAAAFAPDIDRIQIAARIG